MEKVDILKTDLINSYFHFTQKSNLESIEQYGLIAQIGDASEMVGDKPRVCLSKGGKGILGITNSFIHKFKETRICDIPERYRKYFRVDDFSSEELIKENVVYDALEKKMKEEVYLVVDAVEGVDFDKDEIFGIGADYDIKGREGHNIAPSKIKQITSTKGENVFQIVNYLYELLLTKNPNSKKVITEMLSDLDGMYEYRKKILSFDR